MLIILGGVSTLYLTLEAPNPKIGSEVIYPDFICGTSTFYDNAASEGRQLFNVYCAACHKIDRDMTGPALKNMGKKYDTLTIAKFLQGDKTIIKSKGYNISCMRFPQLTTADVSKIIKYTQ